MLAKPLTTRVSGLLGLDVSNHSTLTASGMKKRRSSATTVATKVEFSVSFCKTVKAKNTLHHKSYTQEEIEATWYSQSEMQSIRLESKATAQEIQRRQSKKEQQTQEDDDENFVARGLEARTKRGAELRMQRRASSINLVLDEQHRQQVMGDYDPEYLSLVYKQSCQPSLLDAQRNAQQDAEQATSWILEDFRLQTL